MPDCDVLVLGAGLAGCSTAWSLAQRGLKVIVLDRHTEIAREASGNPAGIFMPVLEAAPSPKEAFYLDALRLLHERLAEASDRVSYQACGVLHLPRDEKQGRRFQSIIARQDLGPETVTPLSTQQARRKCGIPITEDGLYYPGGGWVSPRSLCRYYMTHPGITHVPQSNTQTLRRCDGSWAAIDEGGKIILTSDIAIIATGHLSADLEQTAWLPFHTVRGQITRLDLNNAHSLDCVICHQGYVLPLQEKELLIGATYSHDRNDYETDDKEHAENIRMLHQFLPEFVDTLEINASYSGRVGFRCVVPGRLPLVGRLPVPQRLRHRHPPVMYQNLALTTAHASRGILSSGIAGEMIACELFNETNPYEQYRKLVSPTRFLRHV
jgi:tRNA 5-methylaminomethyl-2-thiouridine biosynthesis bifunctional protein